MLDVIVERELAHGLLLGIAVPVDANALVGTLPYQEQVIAAAFGDRRKLTFAAGRAVLHHALSKLGVEPAPVLRDDRGAPLMPRGVIGSVSHKESIACALVTRTPDDDVHIGVDVERIGAVKAEHASLILTDAERTRITGDRALVLALSLKESLYKALDPFVRRYVGFKEVEIFIDDGGGARFVLDIDEGPYRTEGSWFEHGDHVITTARVRD